MVFVNLKWERKIGELLARLEKSPEQRKQLIFEIMAGHPTVQVAYFCERARIAESLEEFWEIVEECCRLNLLIEIDAESIRGSPSEGLAIFQEETAYFPFNFNDKRLQALVLTLRQAFSQLKSRLPQTEEKKGGEEEAGATPNNV